AAEHIRKKEYRYISPTFLHERHGQNRVVRILRAALTNNPALHLVALASLNANQELKKIQELNDKPSNLTKETASMIVNSAALITVFTGFKTLFNKAFEGAESTAMKIAMSVKSETKEENYAWLGQSSRMRQWAGDRVIRNLALHSYAVKNLKFEDTISISRDDIADDKIGVFSPVISDMGRNAKQHPDELLYG
ncbi:MAG: Mu-like prophage major head subunit gpT family protein, partial [Coleofasciculus sp. C2-GNP5-27]